MRLQRESTLSIRVLRIPLLGIVWILDAISMGSIETTQRRIVSHPTQPAGSRGQLPLSNQTSFDIGIAVG